MSGRGFQGRAKAGQAPLLPLLDDDVQEPVWRATEYRVRVDEPDGWAGRKLPVDKGGIDSAATQARLDITYYYKTILFCAVRLEAAPGL